MERFQIGKFDIDASRCRISTDNYETVLEPKVMDVLCFLHSRQGQVISQQTIFDSVWPGATFNPSSVQRAVALLRKALQEDAKNPIFLKTHPKRGYSLELPRTASHQISKVGYAVAAGLSLLVATALLIMWPLTDVKTQFEQLLPVTSSEYNESFLSVSPDGEYIAFVRGDDTQRDIWLKELNTGKEVKLTSEKSNYNVMGWSPDSTALAFMHIDPHSQERVMAYISLDRLALQAEEKRVLYAFSEVHVNGNQLQWSKDNKVYFVEWSKDTNATWLSYIDLNDSSKHRIRESIGQDWLITIALAPDSARIALGYEQGQNRYRIEILDLNDGDSQSLTELEDGIWGLSWHPKEDAILVSNRQSLQLLDMRGNLSEVNFNNYQFIRDAQYLPGGDTILMELRNVDVDILRKTRGDSDSYETLVDTSSLDFIPVFSPDNERFVFESHRMGLKQLYVYEAGKQRLIFANPNNEELFGTVWTPDGKEVIAASKDKLFRIDVANGTYREIAHSHAPFGLREHYNNESAILVSYRGEDGTTFHPAKLDLSDMSLTPFTGSGERLVCYSMTLDEEDRVYFANSREIFRLSKASSIESLWHTDDANINGLRAKGGRVTVVLAQNQQHQLRELKLDDGTSTVIYQGTEDGTMLTNSSSDHEQFLYLSKPEKSSRLVSLK